MLEDRPTDHPDFHSPVSPDSDSKKWLYIALLLLSVLVLTLSGIVLYMMMTQPDKKQAEGSKKVAVSSGKKILELDTKKNYGNKYANGLLPVGDGKYSTTGAEKGSVYSCSTFIQNNGEGGAKSRGPWFKNNNTQYDITKKARVRGDVSWQGSFSNTISGTMRQITTNDLPLSHATGFYPVASNDPAYEHDHNPNSIKAQTLAYSLKANPTYGELQCVGAEVGIMLTGVALFSAFDDAKRDAGAWEVQDKCDGHPQISGEYHYHTLSACFADTGVDTVIGFALDGFPITGPKVSAGNYLTTADLDECHGIKSEIILDGKKVNQYHYVMTQDFPYSVSCFRAKPSQPPMHSQDGPTMTPKPPSQPPTP